MKNRLFYIMLLAVVFCLAFPLTAWADGSINVTNGSGTGSGWTYDNTSLITINAAGDYEITGTTTTNIILVNGGVTADITLNGVSIDVSASPNVCAFAITGSSTVNLTLVGSSTLKSGTERAGLQVQAGNTLAIVGGGTLYATGGAGSPAGGGGGAGIGGGGSFFTGGAGGTISISGSANITATGGMGLVGGGAGIGGGGGYTSGGAGGDISISGSANITATGGEDTSGLSGGGAGIGGGGGNNSGGAGGTISIGDSANINASGGASSTGGGSGIGGGGGYTNGGAAGNIGISGPCTVNASGGSGAGGYNGANIGTGGSSGIGPGTGPGIPIIWFSAQPAATTTVTAGSINASLTLTAHITTNSPLNYQWYSNTTYSNTGGSAVGTNSTTFTIPTNLAAGTHYFYCKVTDPSLNAAAYNSAVAVVTVSAVPPTPTAPTGGGSSSSSYSIKFNTNGGSSIASKTVNSGSTLSKPANPVKEGYTFGGWYTDSACTKEYDFTSKVTSTITLYAKWIAEEPQQPTYQPMTPLHSPGTAVQAAKSANTLVLGGEQTGFPAVNIGGYNWLKLRDVAALLNGTGKQFAISYNAQTGVIDISTGQAYAPTGSELTDTLAAIETATASLQQLRVNGELIDIAAYNIGGYNYLRLRDIAILLDFGVAFDAASGQITLDFGKPYSE